MEKFALSALFGLLLLDGCIFQENYAPFGYENIGNYRTRTEAEQQAVKTLLDRYAANALPTGGEYKVIYRFDQPPGMRQHAIHYQPGKAQLGLETDIQSGTSCRWEGVDPQLLRAIYNDGEGLRSAVRLVDPARQNGLCDQ
ncbi:hypothetical protein [Larkinella soli]|uniref:hypothetical protein n=1 Tax=Larkinella soli TaxID=1770527 RepID=UPI000FFC178A|nr:hypothetical protein [Larkinella soli]